MSTLPEHSTPISKAGDHVYIFLVNGPVSFTEIREIALLKKVEQGESSFIAFWTEVANILIMELQ